MRHVNQLFLVIAVGVLVIPTVGQAQDYDYETIDFPGSVESQLSDMNERGDAVGFALIPPDILPFVYGTKKSAFTTIAPVASYDQTRIFGIADNGDTVGSVVDFDTGVQSGLILDRNGNVTVVDHPDSVGFTQARGINNRGLVTGWAQVAAGPTPLLNRFVGFMYDPKDGSFIDIDTSRLTIAKGINSRGDVVGSSLVGSLFGVDDPCGNDSFSARYAWLQTADGNITYFTVNGQSTSTNARGISDSGTIVGWVSGPSGVKGFVTEIDGTQCQDITIADEDLLEYPEAQQTFGLGITNSGVVIGEYVDASGSPHGFIATPK
jgi:hypothetical protein